MNLAVRLARAVEGARHKGVVLRRVAEDHQFSRTDTVALCGDLGRAADDGAHHCNGIHIDAGLGEPMLMLLQTSSVWASASGIDSISSRSPAENPFWTRAEKPPTKLTPTSLAAASSVLANSTGQGLCILPAAWR